LIPGQNDHLPQQNHFETKQAPVQIGDPGLVSPADVMPTSFEFSLRLVLASRNLTRHLVIQFSCRHDPLL
jgi:hypothetical protein